MSKKDKVFAGLSVFFANRTQPNDHHNWLVKQSRPMVNAVRTKPNGKKVYRNLFVSKDVVVTVTKTHTTLKFANDVTRPLFQILDD